MAKSAAGGSNEPVEKGGNLQVEVNAYVHQQIEQLKQFLPADAVVGVIIKPADQQGEVTVSLVFNWKQLKIEVAGKSTDIFDAIGKAGEVALSQLRVIHETTTDSRGRSAAINELLKSRNIH